MVETNTRGAGTVNGCSWADVVNEYRKKALSLSNGDAWLLKVERCATGSAHPLSARSRMLLDTLDRIVQMMPPEQCIKLEGKISRIVRSAGVWQESYDAQLRDLLVEVLGWGWLHNRYPSGAAHFNETPDLLVIDSNGAVVAAMECKNFNLSDNERDFMQSEEAYVRNLSTGAPRELLAKVTSTLEKARFQLAEVQYACDKFIFIRFSFDLDIMMSEVDSKELGEASVYQQVIQHIKLWAECLRKDGIELIALQNS